MIANKSDMRNSNPEIFGACLHKSKFNWLHVDGTEEFYFKRFNKIDLESDRDQYCMDCGSQVDCFSVLFNFCSMDLTSVWFVRTNKNLA